MEEKVIKELKEELDKIYIILNKELLSCNRPGIDANALKIVNIVYYGESVSLSTLASIKTLPQRQMLISPFDKDVLSEIALAISKRYPSLTPNVEQDCIRIHVPVVSEDSRSQCVKDLKLVCEKQKIATRNMRRLFNNQLKNNKDISENVLEMLHELIDKEITNFIKKIDQFLSKNTKLIMEI